MARLSGKVAIVTGAASGIGRAAVDLFATEGAQVLAVDLPQAANLGQDVAATATTAVRPLEADVTAHDAPQRIVDAALAAFGSLDILFNNAGIARWELAEETSDETWDAQFAVNARAMFRLCRQAIPALRRSAEAKGRARIINTASVLALRADIGVMAYAASKHAVAGMTKTLALELGKYRITANFLLPGAIETGMTRDSFADPAIRAVWEKKAALRRLGTPLDIARAALLLASDEADFITGHGLVADGGLTLRL